MKSFLLLVLSLTTGCEAKDKVKGCTGAWVEFTCNYPKSNSQSVDKVYHKQKNIRSTRNNEWEVQDRFSLYHDTQNRNLRVFIKHLVQDDFGDYQCRPHQSGSHTKDLQLDPEKSCVTKVIQTAYTTAETTITCHYNLGSTSKSSVRFFCKMNISTCKEILSADSPPQSNGRFTLTNTNSGFTVSISNVSLKDNGSYWCGVKPDKGRYRTGLTEIQLKVQKIKYFTKSPIVGQNLTYWCGYHNGTYKNKFICKGEDPSTCQHLVSTNGGGEVERFSMKDDKSQNNITVTVTKVTANDTGTYWCGAESTESGHRNQFLHKLVMTVVTPPLPPPSPAPSTQSTTSASAGSHVSPIPPAPSTTSASAGSLGHSHVAITVSVCVVVLLLLLLVTSLILIYKQCSHSTNPGNAAAAQHIREDVVYEEIQEQLQKSDSGNEMTTTYSNANFPTDPSASLFYCTLKFPDRSDKAGAEMLLVKPSSSVCEYSTVKNSQSTIYSTVDQPCTSTEDPLYATVNKTAAVKERSAQNL